MSLGKEIAKLKQDKRLTEWHVNQGKLKKEELKAHLDSLPDLASNVEQFGLENERDGFSSVDEKHGQE